MSVFTLNLYAGVTYRRNTIDWVSPDSPHYQQAMKFALGRLREGREVAGFFRERFSGRRRILDIGSGNGGGAIGMAHDPLFEVTAIDILINRDLLRLRERLGIPSHQVVGVGEALPFNDESFDIILCLDTIEHVPHARGMAQEIVRLLRPGGTCMVTTPARLRQWNKVPAASARLPPGMDRDKAAAPNPSLRGGTYLLARQGHYPPLSTTAHCRSTLEQTSTT